MSKFFLLLASATFCAALGSLTSSALADGFNPDTNVSHDPSHPSPYGGYSFSFRVGSVLIRKTRMRDTGADTVWAKVTVWKNGALVDSREQGPFEWRSQQTGFFNPGLGVALPVEHANDTVDLDVQILNEGHDTDKQHLFDKAAKALQSAAVAKLGITAVGGTLCATVVGCAGIVAAVLGGKLYDFLDPNCDGPVVLWHQQYTGQQLRLLTWYPPHKEMGLQVPGTGCDPSFVNSTPDCNTFHGAESPAGCGSNSDYRLDAYLYRSNGPGTENY